MSQSALPEHSGMPSHPSSSNSPVDDLTTKDKGRKPKEPEFALVPAHRSHDSSYNHKRSDPFMFGSRFLEADDDVFEFNAWDHVMPDYSYYAFAEQQFAIQRASPASDFDKNRINAEPAKWWNIFYKNNTANFFKNRKWLHQEFPILTKLTAEDAGPVKILEIGAGAGNTAFPILAANENRELMIYACDFSNKAVDLIRNNGAYDPHHIQASVWDVSDSSLPEGVAEESIDIVLLIFIFSALHPGQWEAAVKNVFRVLKPGGEVCFRDYGRGDLAQVRFKKGRLLQENFYIRGDGTRVYFFNEEELKRIWGDTTLADSETQPTSGNISIEKTNLQSDIAKKWPQANLIVGGSQKPAFDVVSLGVDRRMLVNRKRELKMHRCWMQGCFKKPFLGFSR